MARRPHSRNKGRKRGARRDGGAQRRQGDSAEKAPRDDRRSRGGEGAGQRPTLEGSVSPLNLEGAGNLLEIDGRRFTVADAVPGDQLVIRPLRDKGQPIPARVVKVLKPSPARTAAPCGLLGRCGGCACQSMAYESQLQAKREALVRTLSPWCPSEMVDSVRGLSAPFGYRTRLLVQAAPPSKGERGLRLGFFQRGTTQLVEGAGCPVQHPLTLATLAMVRQALIAEKIRATMPGDPDVRGWLHGVAIRVDPPTQSSEVTLIVRKARHDSLPQLVARLSMLPGLSSLNLAVNPTRSSYLFDGATFKHLAGARRAIFHLGGQAFHLSPGAFFQTSYEGANLLAQVVEEMLPESIETLADLYGGVGVFARLNAARWRQAVVAESNPKAVADLRAFLNQPEAPEGLSVLEGPVEGVLPEVLAMNPDAVILDPPRSGCAEGVVSRLAKARPGVVVYVSCHAPSLSRDGASLLARGYKLERVVAVDMFPHTHHLETVARFVAA